MLLIVLGCVAIMAYFIGHAVGERSGYKLGLQIGSYRWESVANMWHKEHDMPTYEEMQTRDDAWPELVGEERGI